MKNQALFSSKDKCKKLKCRLLQFLFGALRVNIILVLREIKQCRPRSKCSVVGQSDQELHCFSF